MSDLHELLPVIPSKIGAEPVQTVNARDLHGFLEVQAKFSDWIKYQIDAFEFAQDVDFVVIPVNVADATAFGGFRKAIDYHITLDMAKEVSMVSRTKKGKEARQYFIACEKFAQGVLNAPAYASPPPLLPSAIGRAMIDDMLYISRMLKVPDSYAIGIAASQAAQVTGLPWDRLLTQAAAMNDVPEEEMMLEPTELGKRFGGISARAMNLQLAALGLQSKATGSWEPTEAGKPMSIRHAWSDGPKTGYNLKWNVAAIAKLLQPSDSDEDR